MNVLLIHQAFTTPAEGGGTRHYEFARGARTDGIRMTVVASNVSYLTGQPTATVKGLYAEQNIDDIRVLRARTLRTLHASFIWRVAAFCSFMLSSFLTACRAGPTDVVMGTTPPIFQAVSALLVAAVRRRPFLLEVRDLWPEFAIGMQVLTNPVLIRLSRWLERFLYRHATHLLVNSPAYRDYLEGKGIPASRITLIPNGVDPDMFAPDDTAPGIRREFSIETAFVVTYAGALGLANDVDCILGAAAHLRDTHPSVVFLLAGDGKERTRLEDAARRDQLTNVRFAGSRPKSQMKAILAASDACVATLQPIPMFTTTYPNKVFDYMAAGRPTILAIDGVIRTVIEDCRGGLFVPPGDPLALAEAVATLCTDRNAARAMGRRARDHVVKHFNRHDHARLFSTLIRSLARP